MTPAAQHPPASPRLQVATLEQKIQGRGTGGCVYVMADELDLLMKMAWEGAIAVERRELMLSILRQTPVLDT